MAAGDKHKLAIQTEEEESSALFLRTMIAEGDAPDGTHVEISLAGYSLVLAHYTPNRERTVHSINLSELLQTWAKAIDERGPRA